MKDNVLYRLYRKTSETTETCFYVECNKPMNDAEYATLRWLLAETYEQDRLRADSWLANKGRVREVGPRLNFATPFSTNAVAICHSIGLHSVTRLEHSRVLISEEIPAHDRMTEMVYPVTLKSYEMAAKPDEVFAIPLLEEGLDALRRYNKELGLAMDEADIDYCHELFADCMGRNPTNVEVMQIGVANSEHCRHGVFNADIVINGEVMPHTLFELVKAPLNAHSDGSVIAFHDNSSAIEGWEQSILAPQNPGEMCAFTAYKGKYCVLFTAETHNFPTGVAPFPGAETGTGGRIRDVQATGRGGLVCSATTGYCVAGLDLGDYRIPGSDNSFVYPVTLASPLDILIQGSNGASDYGNKFGEPVITGFCRSFDLRVYGGKERRAWLKPILFTGGLGIMLTMHCEKHAPEAGMLIVQIGGPAYRIGMGGGSASSMIQGANTVELDFNAVQRGDAEMGRKGDRVIRACIEMCANNPIESIHDQGAGGPCNVLTELINPAGGNVEIRRITCGDKTMSVVELWLAEYQERNGLLIRPENLEMFQAICRRERVNCEVLGEITGDGRIVLHDAQDDSTPVDLELARILGKLPQKVFAADRPKYKLESLSIPRGVTLEELTKMTFQQLSVGSKGFLVHKVDRSVTGLIAQQQCCGPFQLPVCDVAIIAGNTLSPEPHGAATAIGEQPIKIFVNREAGARMAVAEAVTNLAAAYINGGLWNTKCSANEMWAAKQPGEIASLYDAVSAMSNFMTEIGIAIDGGKDSLSMAAKVGEETVKAPGQIVVSLYAAMQDATLVATPDIKYPGHSVLLLIHLNDKMRLGGSALAQALGQIGNESPDIEEADKLVQAFSAEQQLLCCGLIRAYHDRSDGGLITTVSEMIMSAGCGCELTIPVNVDPVSWLFNEEFGMVIECFERDLMRLEYQMTLASFDNIKYTRIGKTTSKREMAVKNSADEVILNVSTSQLRDWWEQTSDELEKRQMNPECALAQIETRRIHTQTPAYRLTFNPTTSPSYDSMDYHPKVAIIREEGSNGDREMATAFHLAGFEVWDVTMPDMLEGDPDMLDDFRGIAFVGGFSYADALDSAKGWAGTIRFNLKLKEMFECFYNRDDTFSLGVCNGCQLMTLLGIVPWRDIGDRLQPRFMHNASGRFESRWAMVRIENSRAMMLKGMGGSILGIPVAHGEGRLFCPDPVMLKKCKQSLAPIVYVDDIGNPTELYPFNPNGSPGGITALWDPSGRHLAMMPHPERAFWMWQWHYVREFMKVLQASPWMRMFQNAYEWCKATEPLVESASDDDYSDID
ncbi:MAG: phosphoribosylformylglycinamidine synthase [Patescibacteria group bacterium]